MQPARPVPETPRPHLSDPAWPPWMSPAPSDYSNRPPQPIHLTLPSRERSIQRTTRSLQSPLSSPSYSSSPLFLDSGSSTSVEQPRRLLIRKRPRIADLKHYESSPVVPSKPSPALPTPCGRTAQRRVVSADPAKRAKTWFTSPDRFVSSRTPSSGGESPVRLGRSIPSLTPRERYNRRRDPHIDPFRSPSASRSRTIAKRRLPNALNQTWPVQYTPSFVNGNDATPRHTEIAMPTRTPRQISAGAVWNVGGPLAAQMIPASAVVSGRGGLLGSGTNAPMHVAHFLDHRTPDQETRRHENRLALALDLDPANRILSNMREDPFIDRTQSPFAAPGTYGWRNHTWISGHYQRRKTGPSETRTNVTD